MRRYFSNPSRPAWAGMVLVIALVARDQWREPGAIGGSLDAARPTINVEGIAEIRDSLQPSDRVVCTDELGCLMTIGRIDRWLALDDYVRERFLVRRGDGPATGVYTGVPAAFRPADLFAANADGTSPDRILVVDIFKEYPIGNSRSWLPKAIEEDGLKVIPLLETPQIRILEVSPPTTFAVAGDVKASDVDPGPPLRVPQSGAPARFHRNRGDYPFARHWRDDGNFLGRAGGVAASARVSGG
jgi:hypothetical protein